MPTLVAWAGCKGGVTAWHEGSEEQGRHRKGGRTERWREMAERQVARASLGCLPLDHWLLPWSSKQPLSMRGCWEGESCSLALHAIPPPPTTVSPSLSWQLELGFGARKGFLGLRDGCRVWVEKAEKPKEERSRRKGLRDGGWAQEHLGQCEGAGGVGGSSPHPR